jgi:hypothetical protein
VEPCCGAFAQRLALGTEEVCEQASLLCALSLVSLKRMLRFCLVSF